jgi:hypothetical protein
MPNAMYDDDDEWCATDLLDWAKLQSVMLLIESEKFW